MNAEVQQSFVQKNWPEITHGRSDSLLVYACGNR